MPTVLTAGQHWIFVTFTSWVAILGGLLLWAGFFYLGRISQRFEKAYGRITHWQFLLWAPTGIVGYLVMQSVASLQHQNMGPIEQWIGYLMLVWSAALCLWGVWRFRQLINAVSQED